MQAVAADICWLSQYDIAEIKRLAAKRGIKVSAYDLMRREKRRCQRVGIRVPRKPVGDRKPASFSSLSDISSALI